MQAHDPQPSTSHSHYEELCALAAAGQLDQEEWEELRKHLEMCRACRETQVELSHIMLVLAQGPSPETPAIRSREAVQRLERFVARARSEGIPLAGVPAAAQRVSYVPSFRSIAAWGTIAALFGLFAFLAGARFRIPEHKEVVKTHPIVRNDQSVSRLSVDLSKSREALQAGQERERSLVAKLQVEEGRLAQLQRDKNDLAARIASLDAGNRKLQNASAELATAKQENEELRTQENAAKAAALSAEADLRDVRASIGKLSSQLNQERQLNEALEEARRLIVSRNVHVIDIGDVNSRGKSDRPSGRIFYVKNESLVFYAYDLTEAGKLASRNSFYVWGVKEGAGEAARSLGRLENEDRKDDRWSFRLNDADILARINTVFVTAEPNNAAVNRPTGEQIMTTSLAIRPNHP
ncbi:MAG TPA: hypothetical protein VFK06_18035 [Candidatus Angelobacter sp.]|nr:hypothetical protein [Candidatus Angelobacter sp.]